MNPSPAIHSGERWQRIENGAGALFSEPARSVIVETDGDVYLIPVTGTSIADELPFFLSAVAGQQFNVQHGGVGESSAANVISLF